MLKKVLKWIGIILLGFIILLIVTPTPDTKKEDTKEVVQEAYIEKPAMVGGDDLDELSDSRVNVWATAEMPGKETPIAKIPNKSDVLVIDEKEVTNELDQKITYYKIRYEDTEGWVGQNIVTFK